MDQKYIFINSEKDLKSYLTKPICNGHIDMDTNTFFSCVKEQSFSTLVKFDNCQFNLSNHGSKIGMDLGYGIEFIDCLFSNLLDLIYIGIKSKTGDSGLSFKNCKFKNGVKLDSIFISADSLQSVQILFENCEIEKQCILNKININNNFKFESSICIRNSKINEFLNEESDSEVLQIYNSEIKLLRIYKCNSIKIIFSQNEIKKIDFEKIKKIEIDEILKSELVSFTDISKVVNPFKFDNNCNYEFEKVTFESTFSIEDKDLNKTIKANNYIIAKNCIFEDEVNLNSSIWEELRFEDTSFRDKLWISDSSIDNLYFLNCKFEKTVKIFNLLNPIKNADFSLSTIEGLFLFNGWDGERLNFEEEAEVNFSNIYLSNSGYVIIKAINSKDINNGNFSFESSNILGVVVFSDANIRSLDLNSASIIGSFNAENLNVKNYKNRKTFLILKNEAFKKGDNISAIKYKSLEMKQYKKELKVNKHTFNEQLLLYLNTLSNNNGISWTRGVCFTCITALVFFIIINYYGIDKPNSPFFEWGWFGLDSFSDVWKNYLNMFYLTDFKEKFNDSIKLNAIGDTLFFVSKIFVGYGIYQTISAFRKYGK